MGAGASRDSTQGNATGGKDRPVDQSVAEKIDESIVKLLSPQDSQLFPVSGIRRALLVGVTYKDSEESVKKDCKGASNDVYRLRDMLSHDYEWDSSYMTILEDDGHLTGEPTRSNIINCLQSMVADTRPGDLNLLFFGCSCVLDGPSGFSLIPSDYFPQKLPEKLITSKEIHGLLARLPQASNTVVILDGSLARPSNAIIKLGYEMSFDVSPVASANGSDFRLSDWSPNKGVALESQRSPRTHASVSFIVSTMPSQLLVPAIGSWRDVTYPDPTGALTPGSVFSASLGEALHAISTRGGNQRNLKSLMLELNGRLAFHKYPQRAVLLTSSRQLADVPFTL
mmetsp:Transcript_3883/g.6836  ORF Transcript_3883/g.6836 Transcript_3883/m.6836 type:complete len:340 (-) Transcript_3883:2432-3451(-)|eukprot:CAMPEP_0175080674 /NCGR_PEP_ID=MMETSP0052_2-20121109/25658_1 /TAXON_ID=51329 ORGANISM="Polytomella parva, Strain SAG 63-3" /NCGR_SAMPLE_ID=MMETSP0052_2 /ASSEMBLY_ACC=CAM_ASM_000194 /LENGTH=339 /DNA_ID=CAMNT_0016351439 /DNA_START=130 /DNA_END=1149 /DNA_ORIENTATION=+